MDSHLTPKPSDEMIEDALHTYPVTSLPKDLTLAVMSRIQRTAAPRYRVTLYDLLLSMVFTAVILAVLFGIQSLPAPILIQLRIQGILLWQSILVNARWLVPALSFGLASLVAALAIPPLLKMTTNDGR